MCVLLLGLFCGLFVLSTPPHPLALPRRLLPALITDTAVTAVLVAAHALVLLCHGMALSVAFHSTRAAALVALTVAANFVEIKAAVFKRYDATKLYTLACQAREEGGLGGWWVRGRGL